MPERRTPKGPMSDEHKAKLAQGRADAKAVEGYLEALRANKPKRGRKRTPESISARLDTIAAELAEADPIRELELVQERMNLENELGSMGTQIDMSDIETQFVKVAQGYSARKGISYAAWRAVGVEPSVLKKAGISRSS
jgi:uncharacterized protein YicC (UPF0701 family)